MTAKDVATIAFKTLAAWLLASGIAGLCSALLTWDHDVAQYGKDTAMLTASAAALFIPIGAIWWLLSDWTAGRIFRGRGESVAVALDRSDLYAFASVLVGLFLLADALPQIVYWLVMWRMSRGSGFWSPPPPGTEDNAAVHWLAVRAQVGTVAAKLILGLVFVCGPDQVKLGLSRLRREFSGHLDEPPAETKGEPPNDRGGA